MQISAVLPGQIVGVADVSGEKKRGKEGEESAGEEKFLTNCMWPPAGTLVPVNQELFP